MTSAERKEDDLRRQADIAKLREEVLSSLPGTPGVARGGDAAPLTPKTLRAIRAETAIVSDGALKPLVSGNAASWEAIGTELSVLPLPEVKKLLVQLRGEGGEAPPSRRADVTKAVVAQLQSRAG